MGRLSSYSTAQSLATGSGSAAVAPFGDVGAQEASSAASSAGGMQGASSAPGSANHPAGIEGPQGSCSAAGSGRPFQGVGERGTPFHVRQRQDNAAGGRGKRRPIRVMLPRSGKKRQHGGHAEDDDEEPEVPGIPIGDEGDRGLQSIRTSLILILANRAPEEEKGGVFPRGQGPKQNETCPSGGS